MALKLKLKKEEFDALSEDIKKEYKKDGDGFKLDVDDVEIAAEMRRARDREKQAKEAAEQKVTELETRIEQLEEVGAKKSGDITEIEKGWQKKLDKIKTESEAKVTTLKSQLEKVMVDNALKDIATEIFTKPNRDVRLLKDRVYVEYEGEEPIVRVRGADGKASALTLDDLKKETLDNPEYKDILVGSKATGSGGAGGNKGGGAAKQPNEYTEAERVALYQSNRAEFQRLFPQTAA